MEASVGVSIIIPVYNLENELSDCLTSCINQTFRNIEIILVNDGSKDKSLSIINEFQKIDKRIVVISKKNEGLVLARKTGVENAKGLFVFHLDGDDYIPVDAIEKLYIKAISFDAEIAVGDFALYRKSDLYEIRHYCWSSINTGEKFLEHILLNNLHYLCGKLIKRQLYTDKKIMFPKKVSIGEDQVQMLQLCMYTNRVIGLDGVVYNYILHDESMTRGRIRDYKYSSDLSNYADALYTIKSLFSYSNIILQQINIRIILALNRAVLISGRYEGNKSHLRLIHFKTARDLFLEGSVHLYRLKLILKGFVSILFPCFPYYYHRLKIAGKVKIWLSLNFF